MKTFVKSGIVVLLVLGALREFSLAQTDSSGYSIATPRPINPAASTTNPSALATQSQNPYLGSTLSGKATDQKFTLSNTGEYHALSDLTEPSATEEALRNRSDLRSAEANVRAAQYGVRSEKAQRYPAIALNFNYGGAGVNVGSFNSVYSLAGSISFPIFTGGRIRADIDAAQANLARRQAEYEDLKGRVAYDVRVAWLDMQASDSGVKVAEKNQVLAGRALTQSRDRYTNGVTNYLEVVEAQQTLVAARENYIQSLYSFNVSKMALARAMGIAEQRFSEFFGGQ